MATSTSYGTPELQAINLISATSQKQKTISKIYKAQGWTTDHQPPPQGVYQIGVV